MCISYPFATNLSGALSSAMWQEQGNNMVPASSWILWGPQARSHTPWLSRYRATEMRSLEKAPLRSSRVTGVTQKSSPHQMIF